ncbi:MAG: hypothetical protein ACYDHX_15685, partial [Methanothrix sp.]
ALNARISPLRRMALDMETRTTFTISYGLPRVGLRASRELPGASLKAATGQGRRSFSVTGES